MRPMLGEPFDAGGGDVVQRASAEGLARSWPCVGREDVPDVRRLVAAWCRELDDRGGGRRTPFEDGVGEEPRRLRHLGEPIEESVRVVDAVLTEHADDLAGDAPADLLDVR